MCTCFGVNIDGFTGISVLADLKVYHVTINCSRSCVFERERERERD
jgi:hypothetical protein